MHGWACKACFTTSHCYVQFRMSNALASMNEVWRVIWIAVVNEIWKHRNSVIFKGEIIFPLVQLKTWSLVTFKSQFTVISFSDWCINLLVCMKMISWCIHLSCMIVCLKCLPLGYLGEFYIGRHECKSTEKSYDWIHV